MAHNNKENQSHPLGLQPGGYLEQQDYQFKCAGLYKYPRFWYSTTKIHPPVYFEADLLSFRCMEPSCNASVTFGLPYCAQHRKTVLQLVVKQSDPVRQLGVFAWSPDPAAVLHETVVFRDSQPICEFQGEVISRAERERRYGRGTAPYALDDRLSDTSIDCALYRHIGALINAPLADQGERANAIFMMGALEATGEPYERWIFGVETSPGQLLPSADVVAVHDIRHGDQILVDYGDKYRFDDCRHGVLWTKARRPPQYSLPSADEDDDEAKPRPKRAKTSVLSKK